MTIRAVQALREGRSTASKDGEAKMEEEPRSTLPVLDYEKPQPVPRLFSKTFIQWVGAVLVLLVMFGVMALAGAPEPLLVFLSLFPFVAIGILFAKSIRAKRRSGGTEEEENAEWEERRRRHQEMLEVAREIYANGPVGRWQIRYGYHHAIGWATVAAKRVIEFQADGKGIYRAADAGGAVPPVNVAFAYRSVGPRRMVVKLAESTLEGWHGVRYGFEINSKSEEPGLVLWLESDNPMPEGLQELWPFQGEFLREEA